MIKEVKMMYSEEELIGVLKKDLLEEFKSISFYLSNLENLDYKKNKKKIDTLIDGSLKHAVVITKLIRSISKDGKMVETVRKRAFKEETAMKELYRYQAGKAVDDKVTKAFLKIAKQEESHERIVNSL